MLESVRLASGNPGIPAAILGPDVSELNHKPTLRVGYQLIIITIIITVAGTLVLGIPPGYFLKLAASSVFMIM